MNFFPVIRSEAVNVVSVVVVAVVPGGFRVTFSVALRGYVPTHLRYLPDNCQFHV